MSGRPLLFSPGGQVIATEKALNEQAEALLIEVFGVLLRLHPKEELQARGEACINELATLVGPETLMRRYPGLKIAAEPVGSAMRIDG